MVLNTHVNDGIVEALGTTANPNGGVWDPNWTGNGWSWNERVSLYQPL